jgi:hypothetical protein
MILTFQMRIKTIDIWILKENLFWDKKQLYYCIYTL